MSSYHFSFNLPGGQWQTPLELVDALPTPLAAAFSAYLESLPPSMAPIPAGVLGTGAMNPRQRNGVGARLTALHRIIDAADVLTRFLAAIMLSDILRNHGSFPDDIHRALVGKLEKPSIVDWRAICDAARKHQETCDMINDPSHPALPFVPGLLAFHSSVWSPILDWIIALRVDVVARTASRDFTPTFTRILLAKYSTHQAEFDLAWVKLGLLLKDYALVACPPSNEDGGIVLLRGRIQSDYGKQGIEQDPSVFIPPYINLEQFCVYLVKRNLPSGPDSSSVKSTSSPRVGINIMHFRPITDPSMPRNDLSGSSLNDFVLDSPPPAFIHLNLFPLIQYNYVYRVQKGQLTVSSDRPAVQLYLRMDARNGRTEYIALMRPWCVAIQYDFMAESEYGYVAHAIPRLPGKADFSRRMRELRDGFVGRQSELDYVSKWMKERRRLGGTLWIHGPKGVGKSAFLSKICDRVMDPAVFPSLPFCLVPFFFSLGDVRCVPKAFFLHAVSIFSSELHVSGRDVRAPSYVQFGQVLEFLHDRACPLKTVVFVIDGLEEVCLAYPTFLQDLAPYIRPGALWIVSSTHPSPVAWSGIQDAWADLTVMELEGLKPHQARQYLEEMCVGLRYDLYAHDEENEEDGVTSNSFISRAHKASEGLPLYLRLLAGDINEGRLTFAAEESLPNGLAAYCDYLLNEIGPTNEEQALFDVLSLLCWAQEPMTDDVVFEVLGLDIEEQDLVEVCEAHPFLQRQITVDGYQGWAICHDYFRQHLKSSSLTKKSRQRALKRLLKWCSKWHEHEEPYALRHYAKHLYLTRPEHIPGFFAEPHLLLWDLASNTKFRATLIKVLKVPDARLSVVRFALETAVVRKDVVQMARFALSLAQLVTDVQEESPLEAFKNGDLERMWNIIDYLDRDVSQVWHVLTALKLKLASDNISQVGKVLTSYAERDLVKVPRWAEPHIIAALSYLIKKGVPCIPLATKILHDGALRDLVSSLITPPLPTPPPPPPDPVPILQSLSQKSRSGSSADITKLGGKNLPTRSPSPSNSKTLTPPTNPSGKHRQSDMIRVSPQVSGSSPLRIPSPVPLDGTVNTNNNSIGPCNRRDSHHMDNITEAEEEPFDPYGLASSVALKIADAMSALQALLDIAMAKSKEQPQVKLFDAVRAKASHLRNGWDRTYAYFQITGALVSLGLTDAAVDTCKIAAKELVALLDGSNRTPRRLSDAAWFSRESRTSTDATDQMRSKICHGLNPTQVSSFFQDISSWMYCETAVAVHATGDIDMAETFLCDALDAARSIDSSELNGKVHALIEVGLAQFKLKREEEAVKTFEEAMRIVDKMEDPAAQVTATRDIAVAEAKAGFTDNSHNTFATATLKVSRVDSYTERAALLRSIALAEGETFGVLSNVSRTVFRAASQIAEQVEDSKDSVRELQKIATGEAKAGFLDSARRTFGLATKKANGIEDLSERARMLLRLAAAQGKYDLREECQTTFIAVMFISKQVEAMQEQSTLSSSSDSSFVDPSSPRGGPLNFSTTKSYLTPFNMSPFRTFGDIPANVVAIVTDDVHRHAACHDLCEIGCAHARAGFEKKAVTMFRSGKDIANTIADPARRSHVMREVGAMEARAGLYEQAKQTFAQATELAEKIHDPMEKAVVILDIAYAEAEGEEARISTRKVSKSAAGGPCGNLAPPSISMLALSPTSPAPSPTPTVKHNIDLSQRENWWDTWLDKEEYYLRRQHQHKLSWDARRAAMDQEEPWRRRGDHEQVLLRRTANCLCENASAMDQVGQGENARTLFTAATEIAKQIRDHAMKAIALLDVAAESARMACFETADVAIAAALEEIEQARGEPMERFVPKLCDVALVMAHPRADYERLFPSRPPQIIQRRQSTTSFDGDSSIERPVSNDVSIISNDTPLPSVTKNSPRLRQRRHSISSNSVGSLRRKNSRLNLDRRSPDVGSDLDSPAPEVVPTPRGDYAGVLSRAVSLAQSQAALSTEFDRVKCLLKIALMYAKLKETAMAQETLGLALKAAREEVGVPEEEESFGFLEMSQLMRTYSIEESDSVAESDWFARLLVPLLIELFKQSPPPPCLSGCDNSTADNNNSTAGLSADQSQSEVPSYLELARDCVMTSFDNQSYHYIMALADLAEAFQENKQPDISQDLIKRSIGSLRRRHSAQAVHRSHPTPQVVPLPWSKIVMSYCRMAPMDTWHEIVGDLPSEGMAAMGVAYYRAGQLSQAETALKKARDLALGACRYMTTLHVPGHLDHSEKPSVDFGALVKVLLGMVESGMEEEATKTLGHMREALQAIGDISVTTGAIRDICTVAESYMKDEKVTQAQSVWCFAREAAQWVRSRKQKASSLRDIAVSLARLGFGQEARYTSKIILTDRRDHLPLVAKALVDSRDSDCITEMQWLLIPCAYKTDASLRMCAHLISVYPDKADDVAELVLSSANTITCPK
eukprot:CAMPEP_0184335376 /NCGR_PEP_ID=MMETSP1089-20130417/3948_1 /TAXON_ID=38269 ORGANISM="Gloeochaete wittrockiana, Strain SAG46.84" /NCGR_SAMPLE_ID=MMETSP1089 /ASSEMBLY_ACC=CAM_ASM_000445 /LENGTH=2440 /DNA_ID=CAMNT_0026659999 /DNA_START=184 /DNA_END=7506 /DNA_ORIENTATION=-